MENKQLLTQTMAILLCTTPETPLGKLLNFCLAAKVETGSSKTPLELVSELMSHPENLSNWISEVIDSDDNYTVEEMVALSEMHLKDPEQFMAQLFTEADQLSQALQGRA